MPVYNGQRHLPSAIESILGQTLSDLELIISDNASTDSTEAICREYAAKDSRVRYYRNARNIGAPGNWNAVFRQARGQYFKWASSNDLCDPRFLEICVKELDEHPDAVMAYPQTRLIRGDSGTMEDYEDRLNLDQESPCERFQAFYERVRLNNVMNGLVRPEVLRRTPLHAGYRADDVVLMGELTLYGKFIEVPKIMFFRRMDSSSAMIMKGRVDIQRHYDPELKRKMLFQRWKPYRGYFSAVLRAPVSAREKACLCRFLWQRLWEDRGYLTRDLREAGKVWFGRRTHEVPGGPGAGGRQQA